MDTNIKTLKVKVNSSENEARKFPGSLGLVYECPKCRVGHALTRVGTDTVKCNICNIEYKKP
jgi:hypothetical protein